MSTKNEKELLLGLHEKVDGLVDKVHSIDITVIKNTASLDEHMRRTTANEEKLDIFEEKIAPALDAYKFLAICLKISVPIFTILGVYYKYFKD